MLSALYVVRANQDVIPPPKANPTPKRQPQLIIGIHKDMASVNFLICQAPKTLLNQTSSDPFAL